MRINVLQHTPNEGPGVIAAWAQRQGHDLYVYHPYQFGQLPTADETDFLVILGGPMSPNDDLPWIKQERQLIHELLSQNVPILGVCFGAQQITKTLGYPVTKAPAKEVGWVPVYRQTTVIPGLPKQLNVLHWHEEMFAIPTTAQLLFSSDRVINQGYVLNHRVVGLQFHLEPAADILTTAVPSENQQAMYRILDYITG
ncbi:type 1 glutamine amidotransferase [Levilactobacillus sp. N40-8-2]|uniref:type 1 glutamine amidotransferase n=1 Tax=Levilactobacillus muriae TaxID=3238987 RepID=UPI0038B3BA3C